MNETMPSFQYDTLIVNGDVIDPGSGLSGRYDVAIADGRIAAVAPGIDRGNASRVVDASGQLVTPGLVDLHTHIYWGVTFWGIEPDPVAARSGVTTWLDAGSAGAYSFPGFRRYVAEASRVRAYCLLNLSAIGLIAPTWEFSNLDYCDAKLAATIIEANRDVVLGVKARIDQNTTRGTGIRALEIARELADAVDLPLMVHIASGPPELDAVVDLLRPGDILTHCCTGGTHRLVDETGLVNEDVRRLREQGLILDIGHGAGSFSYRSAEAMLRQGLVPDVISSDIHQLSVQGPMYDLPTTLSKFLNLGVSLPDAIASATSRPAAAMRRPNLGTLRPGSPADIALFKLEEGDFIFYDVAMEQRKGSVRLVNTLTMVAGEPLERVPEREPEPWAKLAPHQAVLLQRS